MKYKQRNDVLRLEVKRLMAELKTLNGVRPTRETILKRDNYTCRLCGDKEEEEFTHHLTPTANGGRDDISNYITVCESCHMFMHCNPKLIMRRNKRHREATMIGLENAVANGKKLGRPMGKKDLTPRKKSGYYKYPPPTL